jgi:hypothetical protein
MLLLRAQRAYYLLTFSSGLPSLSAASAAWTWLVDGACDGRFDALLRC